MEFFVVITSPRRVTTPCSPEEARAEVEKYIRANRLQKIYPDQATLEQTLDLMRQHPELHAQGVKRGADGQDMYGMKCGACHQLTKLPGPNMPPGVPHWNMPPSTMSMVFEGKSAGDLCRQLKDPQLSWAADHGYSFLIHDRDSIFSHQLA